MRVVEAEVVRVVHENGEEAGSLATGPLAFASELSARFETVFGKFHRPS
jgi:hypothetical protein